MAANLVAMASTLRAMASNLDLVLFQPIYSIYSSPWFEEYPHGGSLAWVPASLEVAQPGVVMSRQIIWRELR